MTVGVAVSTHRRPAVLSRALAGWGRYPPDILVVINDEAGNGVSVTKNAGITALLDAGVSELFLADDDIWPIHPDWAKPYVHNPQPHLMHCWGRSRFQRLDGDLTVWSWPRGVLLYASIEVIERVGGMRTDFGALGGEHVEWSRRIHAAGLTAHPFADVAAARNGIWHCEDYTRAVPSSMTAARYSTAGSAARHALYDKFSGSTDYVAHRVSPGAHTLTG